MRETLHPEDLPADVVEDVCRASSLPEPEVRALLAAAAQVDAFSRIYDAATHAAPQRPAPRRPTPGRRHGSTTPAWMAQLLDELHVPPQDRAEAHELLRALQHATGPEEHHLREYLDAFQLTLGMTPAALIRQQGIRAFGRLQSTTRHYRGAA